MLIIHSRYNPPPQIGERNEEPSLTQQHFKEECDVNQILAKFVKTGILENIGPGAYVDLGEPYDYMTALETIRNADLMFNELPSHIRKEFSNDPAKYLEFVYDPKNKERGIELGIFTSDAKIVLEKPEPKAPENP